MNRHRTNVLIIGGGPSGMFAAHHLLDRGVDGITILESGRDARARQCPLTAACNCRTCHILEGEGGAGGISDGKLTFSLTRGTQLETLFDPGRTETLDEVKRILTEFGPAGVDYSPNGETLPGFEDSPLEFTTYPLRHVGSDGIQEFVINHGDHLRGKGVEVLTRRMVMQLVPSEGMTPDVQEVVVLNRMTGETEIWEAEDIMIASGLFGGGWLEAQLANAMGVSFASGPAGFGLRIEVPAGVVQPIVDRFYDYKVLLDFHGTIFRSFCCNHRGHIMPEYHKSLGIRNVNGHSYLAPEKRSESSNFTVIAKIDAERMGLGNSQDTVRQLARGLNALSGGWQVRQRVNDFMTGSDVPQSPRSHNYVTYPQARLAPIHAALPGFILEGFRAYIRELDKVLPGVISDESSIYGPEQKYFARKVPVDFSTWRLRGSEHTYVLGNATGYIDSFTSAALSGVIAAEHIGGR